MKQTTTTQRESTWQQYIRLYGLILVFLLLGLIGLKAQSVSWSSTYPKLEPATLTALDDPGYVDVYFTPTVADITTAKLEVKLPANYTYVSTENGTGHTAAITYTVAATGTVAAGQTITVTFNSNGNTLKIGQPVYLRFKVTAGCAAVNGVTATVKVMSNTTVVTDGQQDVTYGVAVPVIRVTSDNASQNYTLQTDSKDYELKLDNQNGQAGSLKLTLTGDQYTTLDNFTLDGVTITPDSKNVISGSTSRTIITLTSGTNMTGKLGTTVKKLKFSATNTRCGSHNITSSAQYPATGTACSTQSGVTMTMSYPAIAGTPNMNLTYANWVGSDMSTTLASANVCEDGVTPTWYRLAYKNTGAVSATEIKNSVNLGRSATDTYGYIDIDNIYCSVDGGITKRKVLASEIQVTATLPATSPMYIIKPGFAGKPRAVSVVIDDELLPNKEVVFYYPAINGNIYDNSSLATSTIQNGNSQMSINYFGYSIQAWNACGVEGGKPTNTFGAGSISFPRIPSLTPAIGARPGQTGECRFPFFSGYISVANGISVDAYIQLPSWMSIDGLVTDAIQFENQVGVAQDLGGGKYVIRFDANNGVYDNVVLKYKMTSTCPAPTNENKEAQIRFWLNWNMGTSGTNCDNTLEYFTQQYVPAVLFCKQDGVMIDGFNLHRTTRGLKDSGNNSVPDDGTPGLDNEINHSIYLRQDQGEFMAQMTIAPGSSYPYLYALLSSSDLNMVSDITFGTATMSVNGSPASGTLTRLNDTHFYFAYSNVATPLQAGDIVKITLPFTTLKAADKAQLIDFECYTSNANQSAPFSPTDRHGEDKKGLGLSIYQESTPTTGTTVTLANQTPANRYLTYLASYIYNGFAAPYFKNEIRRVVQARKFTLPLPPGYLISDDQLIVTVSTKLDAPTSGDIKYLLAESKTETDAGITYVFDLTQLYDLTYNSEAGGAVPATGKWMLPDDRFSYDFNAMIQATKGASPSNAVRPITTVYIPSINQEIDITANDVFNYTGTATSLLTSVSTLPAYGKTLNIPTVTVGNPNSTGINSTWLYVTGNVENIKIKNTTTLVESAGTGFEGRWIKVADAIPTTQSLDYSFSFDYTGASSCDAQNFTIYTVSGFETAWTPTTASALNLSDVNHIGARRIISITSAPATISGSIATSTSTLVFNTPYTLTAVLDSRNSEGSLKDAQMEIIIPAGQKYTNSSAVLEYPKGTPISFPADLELALRDANTNLSIARTLIFKSTSLLPGFKADGTTDDDRQLTLKATYTPQCETPLTGISFTGKLTGTSSCGVTAKGNNSMVFSSTMYSNVSSNYAFEVATAIKSGNTAFNENRTTDILKVTIKKISGVGINMSATDSLLIQLPKEFNINGTASIPTGFGAGAVNSTRNMVVLNNRIISLSLPIAAFNGDANKGINQDVVYEIPIIYTPNGQTLAVNPVQVIKADVVTMKQFDLSCPNTPLSIGNKEMNIGVLTSSLPLYKACLKSPVAMVITSDNFDGKWYKEPGKLTQLATTATHTYTPTVQADTTFYVSASISGVDYGVVPVKVQMNPQVTMTISNPAAICLGTTISLKASVTATANATDTVFLAADKSTVITTPTTVKPTAVGTATYYAFTKNTVTGCVSDTTAISVTVNSKPTVSAIALPAAVCEGSPLVLPTPTVTPQGTPVISTAWKINGVAYTPGTALTYANNGKALTFTASSACGDSIVAVGNITVNAKPTVSAITLPATACEGSALTLPTPTVTARGSAVTAQTWKIDGVVYTAGSPLTYANNGKSLTFTAYSACGDSIVTVGNIIVNAKPAVSALTLPPAICEGSSLTLPTPTVTARGSAITTQTWKINGVAYTAGTPLTYANNGKALTFTASSACGDSIVVLGNIIVNAKPAVAPMVVPATACEGSPLTLPTPAITVRGSAVTTQTWKINGVAYTPGTPITYASTGKALTFTAASACGDSTVVLGNITVNAKPTVTPMTLPAAICEGNALSLPTPTVAARGTAITAQTWKIGTVTYTPGTNLSYADNGKALSFTASSACGDSIVSLGNIIINAKPTVSAITLPAAICEGNPLTLPTPTVTARGTAITAQTWKINGAAYTPGTALAYTDNGKTLTFNASSACGDSVVTVGNITVYQTTAISTQPVVPAPIKLSNGYIIPGSNVNLSVVAVGNNLTYQWYKKVGASVTTLTNTGKYSGTTTPSMAIANAYEAENGDYYVIVTGTCNAVTSTPVTVIAVANQDASLKDLKVDGQTISGFNPATTSYMTTVICNQEQVTLLGTPNYTGVTSITGNGTFHLEPGDNFFNIVILAQDMVTSMTYNVKVIRNCYVPEILKDLQDAVVCIADSHTFEITVKGEGLTYEWYYGNNRIMGANSNTYTVTNTELRDYERYSVIIRSNYQGFQASTYSNKVRLWVADQLPTHLRFSEYPNPAITGNTYHIKVDGYTDVTKYKWSYNKEGVSFSTQTGMAGENETWATFGTLSAGNGTLKVTMEHPCGTRELTQAITVKYPTGTDDVTATSVQVYPNPTSGILKVSGTEMNQQIRVLDITGSLKGTYKSMEGTTTIDLTGYAKGTYMVQYNGKTYKVIKK